MHKNEHLKVNSVVELVTRTQGQMSQDKTRDTESTNILPRILEGNSASECLRSESAAITGNTKKTINQSHRNPGLEAKKGWL